MVYTRHTMSHYISLVGAIGLALMAKMLDTSALRSSAQVRIAISDAVADLQRTRGLWTWDDRHLSQSKIAQGYWQHIGCALGYGLVITVTCANPACPTPTARASLVCGGCEVNAAIYDSRACQVGPSSPSCAQLTAQRTGRGTKCPSALGASGDRPPLGPVDRPRSLSVYSCSAGSRGSEWRDARSSGPCSRV